MHVLRLTHQLTESNTLVLVIPASERMYLVIQVEHLGIVELVYFLYDLQSRLWSVAQARRVQVRSVYAVRKRCERINIIGMRWLRYLICSILKHY